MPTIELVPDSPELKYPGRKPDQVLKGISGRARFALSAGDGVNVSQTGGALDINVKTADISLGGTEYDEGDIDASIRGVAILGEKPTNELAPFALNATNQLDIRPLNISTDNILTTLFDFTRVVAITSTQVGSDEALDVHVSNKTPSSVREEVIQASDSVQTFTYLDFGTRDERVNTIVYSSTSLSTTVTDTFAYTLVSGKYRLDTITTVVT